MAQAKGWRRLAACVGLLAIGGCTASDPADPAASPGRLEEVTVLTGFNITGQDSFVYAAIERGFFRDAGLRVSVKPGKGTGENLKLLTAGQADFAVVDLTAGLIEAGTPGRKRDFTMFAAIYQRSVSCIMALASSGITGPKDLEGRSVGYQPGGVNHTLFPTYARLAGIDKDKVRFQPTAPPQLRPLLVGRTLDAITEIVIGKPSVELAARQPVVVLPYSDVIGDLYGNALATSVTTAMGNPSVVARFRDAMLRGLAYTVDHPDEAARSLVLHQPQVQIAAATAEIRQAIAYTRPGAGEPLGAITPLRVARSIAIIQGSGAIPSGLNPQDAVSFGLTPTPAPRSP